MKKSQISYVTEISNVKIKLIVVDKSLVQSLKDIGARKLILDANAMEFKLNSEESKIRALKNLMKEEIYFVGGSSGWPPSEILKELRDKNVVEGKIKEVVWRGPDEMVTRLC